MAKYCITPQFAGNFSKVLNMNPTDCAIYVSKYINDEKVLERGEIRFKTEFSQKVVDFDYLLENPVNLVRYIDSLPPSKIRQSSRQSSHRKLMDAYGNDVASVSIKARKIAEMFFDKVTEYQARMEGDDGILPSRIDVINSIGVNGIYDKVCEDITRSLMGGEDSCPLYSSNHDAYVKLGFSEEDARRKAINVVRRWDKINKLFSHFKLESIQDVCNYENIIVDPIYLERNDSSDMQSSLSMKDLIKNSQNDIDDPENPVDDDNEGDATTAKDGRGDDPRMMSPDKSLSPMVRHLLSRIRVKDYLGRDEIGDLGFNDYQYMDSHDALNQLLVGTQEMTSGDELIPILQKMEKSPYTSWVSQILGGVKDSLGNEIVPALVVDGKIGDSKLHASLYRALRKSSNLMGVMDYYTNPNTGEVTPGLAYINSNPAEKDLMKRWKMNYSTGNILSESSLYTPTGVLSPSAVETAGKNMDSLNDIKERFSSATSTGLEMDDILPDEAMAVVEESIPSVVKACRDIGIDVSDVDIRTIDSMDCNVVKGKRYSQEDLSSEYSSFSNMLSSLSSIYSKITKNGRIESMMKDNQEVKMDFIDDSYSSFRNLSSLMGRLSPNSLILSTRNNGKSYYSIIAKSKIGTLIQEVKKGYSDDARFKKFLEDEFGKFSFFYHKVLNPDGTIDTEKSRWLSPWLETLYNDRNSRRELEMLSLLKTKKEDVSDISGSLYLHTNLSMFFCGGKIGDDLAWYAFPVPSDSPQVQYMKFTRYSGKRYKETIERKMLSVAMAELERIKVVRKLNRKIEADKVRVEKAIANREGIPGDILRAESIKDFNSNGGSFVFFPELNELIYDKKSNPKGIINLDDESTLSSEKMQGIEDAMLDAIRNATERQVEDILDSKFMDSERQRGLSFIISESESGVSGTHVQAAYSSKYSTIDKVPMENLSEQQQYDRMMAQEEIAKESGKEQIKVETKEQFKNRVRGYISEFVWNSRLANTQMIELSDGDLAFYKKSIDGNQYYKRHKQAIGSGDALDTAIPVDGIKVYPYERSIVIADEILPSNSFFSGKDSNGKEIQGNEDFFKAQLELGTISKESYDIIMNAYKKCNGTDGQSMRSLSSYRKIMIMAGGNMWTDSMENTYRKYLSWLDDRSVKFTTKDINNFTKCIKPFTFSYEEKTINIGSEKSPENIVLKVPVQYKTMEVPLAPMGIFTNNPRMNALARFMENNSIDVVRFESAMKVGLSGVIEANSTDTEGISDEDVERYAGENSIEYDKSDSKRVDELKQEVLLYDTLDKHISNMDYGNFVHITPIDDYVIQQPTPEHNVDSKQVMGTQIVKMGFSDNTGGKITLNNGFQGESGKIEISTKDALDLKEQCLVLDTMGGYYGDDSRDSDDSIDAAFQDNRSLQIALNDAIDSQGESAQELRDSLEIDPETGDFILPLSDPAKMQKISQLMFSIAKRRISRRKSKGGSLLQISSWFTNGLHIVYGGSGNGRHVEYVECLLPASSKKYYSNFADPVTGEVDLKKVPESMRRLIAYRIPSEGHHSTFPLLAVGFTAMAGESGIYLPYDVNQIAGTDHDGDKMYIMFPELNRKSDDIVRYGHKIKDEKGNDVIKYYPVISSERSGYDLDGKRYSPEIAIRRRSARSIYDDLGISVSRSHYMEGQYGEDASLSSVDLYEGKNRNEILASITRSESAEVYYLEMKEASMGLSTNRKDNLMKAIGRMMGQGSIVKLVNPDASISEALLANNFNDVTRASKDFEIKDKKRVFFWKTTTDNGDTAFKSGIEFDSKGEMVPLQVESYSKEQRHNLLFDILYGWLTSPETMNTFLKPSDFTPLRRASRIVNILKSIDFEGFTRLIKDSTLKNGSKSIEDAFESMSDDELESLEKTYRKSYDVTSPLTQIRAFELFSTGKRMLARAANHGTNSYMLQGKSISSSVPVFLDYESKDDLSSVLRYDMDGKPDGYISDGTSGILAASADAVKDLVLDFINVNDFTFDSMEFLLRLGFKSSTAALFMSQPSIVRIAERVSTEKGITSPSDIIRQEYIRVRDMAKGLYYKEGQANPIDSLEKEYEDFLKETDVSNRREMIDSIGNKMSAMVNNPSMETCIFIGEALNRNEPISEQSVKIYYKIQFEVLLQFKQIFLASQELSNETNAVKTDTTKSTGGPTPGDAVVRRLNVMSMKDNVRIMGADKLLSDNFDISGLSRGEQFRKLMECSLPYQQACYLYGTILPMKEMGKFVPFYDEMFMRAASMAQSYSPSSRISKNNIKKLMSNLQFYYVLYGNSFNHTGGLMDTVQDSVDSEGNPIRNEDLSSDVKAEYLERSKQYYKYRFPSVILQAIVDDARKPLKSRNTVYLGKMLLFDHLRIGKSGNLEFIGRDSLSKSEIKQVSSEWESLLNLGDNDEEKTRNRRIAFDLALYNLYVSGFEYGDSFLGLCPASVRSSIPGYAESLREVSNFSKGVDKGLDLQFLYRFFMQYLVNNCKNPMLVPHITGRSTGLKKLLRSKLIDKDGNFKDYYVLPLNTNTKETYEIVSSTSSPVILVNNGKSDMIYYMNSSGQMSDGKGNNGPYIERIGKPSQDMVYNPWIDLVGEKGMYDELSKQFYDGKTSIRIDVMGKGYMLDRFADRTLSLSKIAMNVVDRINSSINESRMKDSLITENLIKNHAILQGERYEKGEIIHEDGTRTPYSLVSKVSTMDRITNPYMKSHKDRFFIFDNTGNGESSSENSFGIDTSETNPQKFKEQVDRAIHDAVYSGKEIVLPKDGIGGRELNESYASYLNERLQWLSDRYAENERKSKEGITIPGNWSQIDIRKLNSTSLEDQVPSDGDLDNQDDGNRVGDDSNEESSPNQEYINNLGESRMVLSNRMETSEIPMIQLTNAEDVLGAVKTPDMAPVEELMKDSGAGQPVSGKSSDVEDSTRRIAELEKSSGWMLEDDGSYREFPEDAGNHGWDELMGRIDNFNEIHSKEGYVAIPVKKFDASENKVSYIVKVMKGRGFESRNSETAIKYDNSLNELLRKYLAEYGVSIGALTSTEIRLHRKGVMDASIGMGMFGGTRELIRIAKGKEGEDALPEEFAHFAFEALGDDNPLVKRLYSLLDDDVVKAILGDEFDEYDSLYCSNRMLLKKEAAGKMLSEYMKGIFEGNDSNKVSERIDSFIRKIKEASMKMFSNADEGYLDSLKKDLDKNFGMLAISILNGEQKLNASCVKGIASLYEIESMNERLESLIGKIVNTEESRLRELKYKYKNTGMYSMERSSVINELSNDLRLHRGAEGITRFIKNSSEVLTNLLSSLKQTNENPSATQLDKIRIARQLREFCTTYSPIIKEIRQEFVESQSSKEMTYTQDLMENLNKLSTVVDDSEAAYEKLAMAYFINAIQPYIGDSLGEVWSKYDGHKITPDEIFKTNYDIGFFDRWFDAMSDSSDIMLQGVAGMTKDAVYRSMQRTIGYKNRLLAIGKEAEDNGITDFSFMYEKDKNGKKTGYYVKGVDYKRYGEDKKKFEEYLEGKYGRSYNARHSKEYIDEVKEWKKEHLEEIGKFQTNFLIMPKVSLYGNMGDAVKQNLWKEFMEIKMELTEPLPDNYTDWRLAVQIESGLMNRIKNADTTHDKGLEIVNALRNKFIGSLDERAVGTNPKQADLDKEDVELLPVYYTRKLENPDNMSTDIVSTLTAFADMSNRFDEMNKIVDYLEAGRDLARESFNKVRTNVVTGGRIGSNKIAKMDDFYAAQVYGRTQAREAIINKSTGKVVDLGWYANLINNLVVTYSLGLNLVSALGNITIGGLQFGTEAISGSLSSGLKSEEGKFFTMKDALAANRIYFSEIIGSIRDMGTKYKTNKLTLWNEKFDSIQNFSGDIRDIKYGKNPLFKNFSPSTIFFMTEAGEHYMQSKISLAVAQRMKLMDNSSHKEISLWDAMEVREIRKDGKGTGVSELVLKDGVTNLDGSRVTEEQLSRFAKRATFINGRLNGLYNPMDKMAAKRYAVGRIFALFKTYIPTAWDRRFGQQIYSGDSGEWSEGYYNTVKNFMVNIFKDLKTGQKNVLSEDWKKLSDGQKVNFFRAMSEMSQLLLMFFCIKFIKWPDKDKGRSWGGRMAEYQLRRLYTQLAAMTPTPALPTEMKKILKSPAAGVTYIEQLLDLFRIDQYSHIMQSGKYKGQPKIVKMATELIPGVKVMGNNLDPSGILKFEKSGQD